MKVRNVMTKTRCTCTGAMTLDLASRRMAELNCAALAVVGHDGRLLGLLTDRDLALAVGRADRHLAEVRVDDVMTRDLYTCDPDERLVTALERMADTKVRRLPVVTAGGRLVGMLSIDDVILWGTPHHGITRKALVAALHTICSAHEPLLQTEQFETPEVVDVD